MQSQKLLGKVVVPPKLRDAKDWEAAAKGSGELGVIPEAEEDEGQHRSKGRAGEGLGIPKRSGEEGQTPNSTPAAAPRSLTHKNQRIWVWS